MEGDFVVSVEELKKLGIEFRSKKHSEKFCEIVQDELEIRIGAKISEGVPESEMEVFEDLIENKGGLDEEESDEKMKEWLLKNRPDFQEVISKESQAIKEELIQYKDKIPGMKKKCYVE